jgi:hypothetical protein
MSRPARQYGNMSETNMTSDDQVQHKRALVVPELPERVLDTYARLWQLEIWLRQLVYLELRALAGDDWVSKVRGAEKPKEADKRLTYMPTPEEDPLSYAQFSELCRIISEEWRLFEHFLPPKSIWAAKLEEVTQVRHRVAHFRAGHRDDLDRVVQLLRDIDHGFWRFCTSYNDSHPVLPASDDPVVEHFLHLDPFPWGPIGDGAWARYGIADPGARLAVTVEALCHPWASWSTPVAGKQGLIYDVEISARLNQAFHYRRFLQRTSSLHKHIIHICLDNLARVVRVTIPACLGPDEVIRIVERTITASQYCLGPYGPQDSDDDSVQKLANASPEYVLGPENPLTFLAPDMPCSFFGV